MRRNAIPPITPPTIAPTSVLLFPVKRRLATPIWLVCAFGLAEKTLTVTEPEWLVTLDLPVQGATAHT